MTQVSRLRLRPDVWDRIFTLLTETLAGIKDRKRVDSFLRDFLSPTERIVLAKRLAVAVMLAKNNDYATIRRTIKVTPNTISKMSFRVKYEGMGLRPVIDWILKKDATQVLLEEIAGLFDTPIKGQGLGRYYSRNAEREQKINKLKTEI